MNKSQLIAMIALTSISCISGSTYHKGGYNNSHPATRFEGQLIKPNKKKIEIETPIQLANRQIKEEKIEEQRKIEETKLKMEREEIERQRIALEKKRKEVEQKEKEESYGINRGDFVRVKEVICDITYYYADDSTLEGGHYDKKSKLLASHDEPVVALPSDVKYGSMLVLNDQIVYNTSMETSNTFKCVDTGGAIQWRDGDKTHMKVDVFVKDCDNETWIEHNLKNKKSVKALLYYK